MALKLVGEKYPHVTLVAEIEHWIRMEKLTVKLALSMSKRAVFIIFEEPSKYPWVFFWDPSTHDVCSVNRGTGIVRFYDWDSIPHKQRVKVKKMFELWKVKSSLND